MNSAQQDQWVEICEAVRAHLAKRVKSMTEMAVEDLALLVKTIDDAQWIEIKVRNWDGMMDQERREMERSKLFGE